LWVKSIIFVTNLNALNSEYKQKMSPTKKLKMELRNLDIKIGDIPPKLTDSTEINWADYVMADDSDAAEINLGDLDLDTDELVTKASAKIKKEKVVTSLVYIHTALSDLGYEMDNHYPFFFTSIVYLSDKELAGFLYVNVDGFHSNCMEESELQLIFSWDSVKDIELVEKGESSIKITIVSEESKLIIYEPYSKNMLVLLSIYKYIWKNALKDEIGINEIAFHTQEEYLHWLQEKN
jgi:desulfoferrodoxin (superoxide reductase-like protein)